MPSFIRIAWLIASKDLRQRLRDRSALRIAFVAPFALALIFSSLLGSLTDFHTTYVVTDLDGGRLAHVLQDEVIGSLVRAGVVDVVPAPTEAAARAAVTGGDATAAFIIPAGFTTAIDTGRPTTLEIVGARDSTLATEIAQALGERFGDGVVAVQLSVATETALSGAAPDAAAQARIAVAAGTMRPPIALVDNAAMLRQLSVPTYFSASMAILFLFFAVQIGIVSVFTERREGTLARLLAGPLGPPVVILGKTLGSFVLGLVAMTVLVGATSEIIHADWGPPIGVAALVVAAVVAAVGISAFVTSFARTMEAATGAGSAVAITLGILGGSFIPSGQGPEVMSALALATPHGWFLRGLGDLHGAGALVTDCLPAVAVLLAMGVLPGAIGLFRARRNLALLMIDLGKVFWIARLNLLRQARDRGDLFALVIVPTIIIIAIALQFSGGSRARIGVFAPAGDRGADAVVAALRSEPSRFDVRLIPDEATLRFEVERGLLEAGLVIPDGFDAGLRGDATATIQFLGTPTSLTAGVRAPIEAALARVGAIATASRIAFADGIGDWNAAEAAAEAGLERVAGLRVTLTEVGEPGLFAGFSGFAVGASTQLVLFIFLTSMTRSTRLVATKRLGVSRRMLATPTSAWTVVAGETAGRFAVAMLQAAYIVAGTAVVFGVSWGDPLATGALIALFGLVAAGAAMLVGAVSANESQAQSRGAFFGLALAALGGCMIPFQAMSADMQALARLVPHTWAVLGIQSVIGNGDGLASVLPEVAVLAAYATVLVVLAGWQFRRAITGAALAQDPAAPRRRFRRLRRRLAG